MHISYYIYLVEPQNNPGFDSQTKECFITDCICCNTILSNTSRDKMTYIKNGKGNGKDLFIRQGGKRAIWWDGKNHWRQGNIADFKAKRFTKSFLRSNNDTNVTIFC